MEHKSAILIIGSAGEMMALRSTVSTRILMVHKAANVNK